MWSRRFSIGAEVAPAGVSFRVWAPDHATCAVVIDGRDHPLDRQPSGYFSGTVAAAAAGTRYRLRPGESKETFPDPASRFQPDGPHGDSMVVDPSAFPWSDERWGGLSLSDLVISEIHLGTFTPEGTWRAAMEKLPLLGEAGINAVEVMPVNEFPGRFGWGYDGVDLWAPSRLYGSPDDFRAFVDAAHAAGIAVIHDVVYNHLGPDGCYLTRYARGYFTDRYDNEWGDAVDFDGEHAAGVREFFRQNAAYWIEEFHLDGLRIDATQSMHDASPTHIVEEVTVSARRAAGRRTIAIIVENEPQDVRMMTRHGVDGMWNDDWHHSMAVALTGFREAYYTDYHGTAQEIVTMARHGFLYQGQRYVWQNKARGTPSLGIAPSRFVAYIDNHDQIANSARGSRMNGRTSLPRWRAATALLLLLPHTPMLFQGQEFGASTPFLYFADQKDELAHAVAKGRRDFLTQFPSFASIAEALPRPEAPATFEASKIDWGERERNSGALGLHRDLIALRRSDPALAPGAARLEGAALAPQALVIRWITEERSDRILLVNLGAELHLSPAPEPLLAPPLGTRWSALWSSEEDRYGGSGTPPLEREDGWHLPAHTAVLMGATAKGGE